MDQESPEVRFARLEEQVTANERVRQAERQADVAALKLAADGTKIHLEALNHENARILAMQSNYVNNDTYNGHINLEMMRNDETMKWRNAIDASRVDKQEHEAFKKEVFTELNKQARDISNAKAKATNSAYILATAIAIVGLILLALQVYNPWKKG